MSEKQKSDKPEFKRGWKVVRDVGNEVLKSCVMNNTIYPVFEWIKAKPYCGPLAVFDSPKNAESFVETNFGFTDDTIIILPCLWVEWEKGRLLADGKFHTFWTITNFGTEDQTLTAEVESGNIPEGTKLAYAVRLVASPFGTLVWGKEYDE